MKNYAIWNLFDINNGNRQPRNGELCAIEWRDVDGIRKIPAVAVWYDGYFYDPWYNPDEDSSKCVFVYYPPIQYQTFETAIPRKCAVMDYTTKLVTRYLVIGNVSFEEERTDEDDT